MSNKTAILFFHRAESQDIRAKRLEKKAVIQYLNRRTKSVLKASNLPVFDHLDQSTSSTTVQQRFYLAVQSVFDAGFEKVIIVGNDCPLLKSKDLHQAAFLLESNDLVLGPDHRGGAYLIGISKTAFSKTWVENLAWHSHGFLDSAIQNQPAVSFLSALPDFNKMHEIQALAKSPLRKHLLKPLLRLIQHIIAFRTVADAQVTEFRIACIALRAPPAILA